MKSNSGASGFYSTFSQDPAFSGSKIQIPPNNYLSGEMISRNYRGSGWYSPYHRDWQMYHEYKQLPTEGRRDSIDMLNNHQFTSFLRKKHIPKAPLIPAYIPGKVPELKIDGNRRLSTMIPSYNQYLPTARLPQWDGPGYYGYYFEAFDRHYGGQMRTLPAMRRYPGHPLLFKFSGV